MGGNYSHHTHNDHAVTDSKLAARVRDLIVKRESLETEHIPFHRILLSFPTLRRTFSKLRVIYNESVTVAHPEASWAREASSVQKTVTSTTIASSSSSLSSSSRSESNPPLLVSQNSALLRNSLKRVGSKGSSSSDGFTDSQLQEIFDTVDFHHLHRLTYRQFLASLTMAYLFGLITLPKKKDRTGTSSRVSSRVTSRAHSRSTSRSGSRSPVEHSEKLQFSEESARALEGDTVAAAAVALEAAFALHDEAVKYVPEVLTKSQTPAAAKLPPSHPPSHSNASVAPSTTATKSSAIEKKASFSILKKSTSHSVGGRGSGELPPKLYRALSTDNASVSATLLESSSTPPSPPHGSSSSSSEAFGADLAHAFDMIFEAYCHLDVAKHGFLRKSDLAHGLHDVHEGSIERGHGTSFDGHAHPLPAVVRTHDITPEKPQSARSSADTNVAGHAAILISQSSSSRPPTSVLEFLTQERFLELDWNANGEVSFAEFLVTFVLWVGVEDDEEETKEEEKRKPTTKLGSKAKSFIARFGLK